MTRRCLIGLVLLGAGAPACAQLSPVWMRQIGTQSWDIASALAADGAGGAFVAGETRGDLGGINPGDEEDAFVARYDASGEQLWIRQFGVVGADAAWALATDMAGGAFVAGDTQLGAGAGGYESFLARYTADGVRLWMRVYGSTFSLTAQDGAYAAAPDGEGGVYVGGRYYLSYGYVARYDGAGDQLWIKVLGIPPAVGIYPVTALAPDGAGGTFVTGESAAWGTQTPVVGVALYDGSGIMQWMKQFSTPLPKTTSAWAAGADGAGGVVITGSTYGDLVGPNAGGIDAFARRYDALGTVLWTRQFGTAGYDLARGGVIPHNGGVLVAGDTGGSLGGPHAGDQDCFLAWFDEAGAPGWNRQIGTSCWDVPRAIVADGRGGAFIAGETCGSLGGPSAGGYDAFIARFAPSCYADCNADGALTVADFGCFQTKFVAGDPYADCNADGQLTVADFGCFQTAFVGGCR